jgi:sensor c-di-GMP phosphodiesterase-like protein
MDRSFVQGIKSSGDNSIINAIIAMAKGLNLDLIAEGVEEEVQINHLLNAGCYLAQGFYYARPMTEDDLLQTYRNHQADDQNSYHAEFSEHMRSGESGDDTPPLQ